MVSLQPLALKNIYLLIFEEFILGKEFNSVAIFDFIAPKLVPYRDGLYMVFVQQLVLKNISVLIFEEFLFHKNVNVHFILQQFQ